MKDTLQPQDRQILSCIASARGITTADIFSAVYKNDEACRWQMYRRIKFLETFGYIDAKLLSPKKGNSSPKFYILRAKGAKEIGLEKAPPNQYRYLNKDFYRFKQIKTELAKLALTQRWILVTDERSKRRHIAEGFKRYAYMHEFPVAPEHIYLQSVPLEIAPDLVLETSKEVVIVILCHPFAQEEAFRKKIEKYASIITDLQYLCICPREEQVSKFQNVLKGQVYEDHFLILFSEQLEYIKSWLV